MLKLALFDVDFTLTKQETMIALYRWMVRRDPRLLRYLPKAAMAGLLFKLGIIRERQTKELFFSFLRNRPMEEVEALADRYLEEVLQSLLYRDGLEKLAALKAEGYHVILTSASPEFYITKLLRLMPADAAMGTLFEVKDGRFTGRMVGENNKGEEKVRRLHHYLEGQAVDYPSSYMFSDSMADGPLLELVGHPYLINYKKKHPKYPVLHWR